MTEKKKRRQIKPSTVQTRVLCVWPYGSYMACLAALWINKIPKNYTIKSGIHDAK